MNQEDIIFIQDYLKGSLSEEDKAAFEQRLKSDKDFAAAYKFERAIFENLSPEDWDFKEHLDSDIDGYRKELDQLDKERFKETFETAYSKLNGTTSPKKISSYILYMVAALILVFLAYQILSPSQNPQNLYNEYFSTEDLPSFVTREANDKTTAYLIEAQQAFEVKDYKKAISLFDLSSPPVDQDIVLMYQGISYLQMNQFEEADEKLNELINTNYLTSEVGYWYLALSKLKQNRIEDSKEILIKIVDNAWYNADQAQDLLADLN